MKEIATVYLPYLLSLITIISTFMAGHKHPQTWTVGIVGQFFWFVWAIVSGAWGFLPSILFLTYLFIRNHIKWKTDETV